MRKTKAVTENYIIQKASRYNNLTWFDQGVYTDRSRAIVDCSKLNSLKNNHTYRAIKRSTITIITEEDLNK